VPLSLLCCSRGLLRCIYRGRVGFALQLRPDVPFYGASQLDVRPRRRVESGRKGEEHNVEGHWRPTMCDWKDGGEWPVDEQLQTLEARRILHVMACSLHPYTFGIWHTSSTLPYVRSRSAPAEMNIQQREEKIVKISHGRACARYRWRGGSVVIICSKEQRASDPCVRKRSLSCCVLSAWVVRGSAPSANPPQI
jgi:hypothetical protein